MKRILLLILLCCLLKQTYAQELNARVQLLAPTVSNLNPATLQMLQETMRNFLNNNKWSADTYLPQERITCNFVITVRAWDGNAGYQAEAQIQSSRPVFGSTYNSTLLNLSDKDFNFTYTEGQPLDFSDQLFINNLSSMLAFYAYTIIGLDKDSFARQGGTPLFTKAQQVMNVAQSSGNAGWKAADGLRNRYWLNENLLNSNYLQLRDFIYSYHIEGLDRLAQDQHTASRNLFKSLTDLSGLDKQRLGAYFPNIFFSGKAEEFGNIFSGLNAAQKRSALDLLSGIDPANAGRYEALK
ncbi:DUF4835 family protein [Pedobacter sp. SAFR-022]|uniref:type IX secretion system protein PorD n=1 Tax=Pedobacter sp. SAFR-022 TaxID=3436861 RepID=UPI003F7F765C